MVQDEDSGFSARELQKRWRLWPWATVGLSLVHHTVRNSSQRSMSPLQPYLHLIYLHLRSIVESQRQSCAPLGTTGCLCTSIYLRYTCADNNSKLGTATYRGKAKRKFFEHVQAEVYQ